ncbi:MAG: 3-oxoacyl-ACP reductase family protein [Nitrososphaerota archaeon]|nr:3-oxoacyl-ACP reductase FabG [Candidatus Calditenuaceae archaeon]MDW8073532.1 3-oxoacyl-ACP reductase family protein [Nitrososphaerota archaeon]
MSRTVGRLDGLVALVTGSSRGIGRGIAVEMAREGARLVIHATSREGMRETARVLGELGADFAEVVSDLSRVEACERTVDEAVERMGRIDILVNNAGVNVAKPAEELSVEEWSWVLSVNLSAPFLCSRHAAKDMMRRRWGRIINIASVTSFMSITGRSAYASSKSGILGLTRTLALELAPHGITVNAIAPGFIATDMVRKRIEEGALNLERLLQRIPMGRLGAPEEVGRLAVFLASPEASYITGQVFVIDGGFLANATP